MSRHDLPELSPLPRPSGPVPPTRVTRLCRTACARGAAMLGVVLVLAGLAGAQSNPEQFRAWPSERPPRPLAAREVAFPPYELRTLSNGLQVITVLHHEQPAVTMRLLVRAGSAQDPREKGGLAGLVANLLDQGTATRSASEIADQIDSIGGLMGTGSGTDLTFVDAVVMKDSFDLAMNLLADVVRNPAFSPDEIERQQEQALSSLQVSAIDGDYIASVVLDRIVYGFHPYGLPGSGTPETLTGITRDDLREFHRRYFVPNNMMLAIVGDVTEEEAFSTAERVFGGWPRGAVPEVTPVEPPPPTRRIVVIDKPDAVQTEIRVGQLGIPRHHPDYLAFDLAVKILGGEGANRLHRVLRSERGLTYGASVQAFALKQAGSFVAETDTRTETTAEVLRLTLGEFARVQSQRVSERELADAQAYLAGSFPLTIETPNQIAAQVLNAVVYELPMEEISTFRERVLAVTPDDIQRVARQYVRPDRLSIVLVGDAPAFLGDLRMAGFADIEVIPIERLDLMSATLTREARVADARPRAPGSDGALGSAWPRAAYTAVQANPRAGAPEAPRAANLAESEAASDLLRRVVETKGGLEALEQVRTMIAEAETTLQMDQRALPSSTTTYIVYPDQFRVDATVEGARIVQVYNAGDAWEQNPLGVRAVTADMREAFAASVRRDTIPLLIAASRGKLGIRSLPDERGRDGARLQVLELEGAHIPSIRLYIDERMQIAKQAFSTAGPDGRQMAVEEILSDYRTVDGVRIAFEAQVLQGGRPVVTRRVTDITLNAPVARDLFERPR